MGKFFMSNPNDRSPERATLIQAYMILHSQQTSVRRRISNSNNADSTPTTSPSTSPSRHSSSRRSTFRRSHSASRSWSPTSPIGPSSLPSLRGTSIPEEPSESESESETVYDADQDKLLDINKQIKTTLTDLLNCESVRHDDRMRAWIQTRLMDAEQQLKHQKRRRVSDDSGVCDSIAGNMVHGNYMPRKVSM